MSFCHLRLVKVRTAPVSRYRAAGRHPGLQCRFASCDYEKYTQPRYLDTGLLADIRGSHGVLPPAITERYAQPRYLDTGLLADIQGFHVVLPPAISESTHSPGI